MGEASEDLNQDDPAGALPKQNDALQQMRKGQKQMQEQMKMKGQPKDGDDGDDLPPRTSPDDRDPMGHDGKAREEVEIDPSKTNNSARIKRELSDELKKPNLPKDYRAYLERLLRGDPTPPPVPRP